jgi:hypothetical protein
MRTVVVVICLVIIGCTEHDARSRAISLVDEANARLKNANDQMLQEAHRLLYGERARRLREIAKRVQDADGDTSILSDKEIDILTESKEKDFDRTRKIQEEYLNATMNGAALIKAISEKCDFETEELDKLLIPIFEKFPYAEKEMWSLRWKYDAQIRYMKVPSECARLEIARGLHRLVWVIQGRSELPLN